MITFWEDMTTSSLNLPEHILLKWAFFRMTWLLHDIALLANMTPPWCSTGKTLDYSAICFCAKHRKSYSKIETQIFEWKNSKKGLHCKNKKTKFHVTSRRNLNFIYSRTKYTFPTKCRHTCRTRIVFFMHFRGQNLFFQQNLNFIIHAARELSFHAFSSTCLMEKYSIFLTDVISVFRLFIRRNCLFLSSERTKFKSRLMGKW
jgi:hypothetical protein